MLTPFKYGILGRPYLIAQLPNELYQHDTIQYGDSPEVNEANGGGDGEVLAGYQ
jgi:hypothetical protein